MKNNKLEDSLNKLFSNSGYKMVDVSDKNITHRKALASGEIVLTVSNASETRVCDDLIFILKYTLYCERIKNKEKKKFSRKVANKIK